MKFEFATATRIIYGRGAFADLGELARTLGARALVVCGGGARRVDEARKRLRDRGVASTVFVVEGEPDLVAVERGAAQARTEGCDFVLGLGGGSAIDAGKAIAAMAANDGVLLDYLEVVGRGHPLRKTPLPFMAVPTTAGTGAEVTRNAVLASPAHRVKASLRSPLMLARIALVDPELTDELPPFLTATTGMDALTQLVEPYVSVRANPLTDGICVEGMRRAARSLRRAFEDGARVDARGDMATASLFGGLALANAGLGAVHGFAAPIGGMFPAPHGAVCAALLPDVMEINIRALAERSAGEDGLRRYEQAARLLTGHPGASARDGVEWTRRLAEDMEIPPLCAYGLAREHIDDLVEKAEKSSSMKANPIVLTRAEMAEILERSID
jgi:alcohol dehydrogenase class IV